jgi:hypothetical protein
MYRLASSRMQQDVSPGQQQDAAAGWPASTWPAAAELLCTELVDKTRDLAIRPVFFQISQIGPIRNLTPIHTYGSM